MKVKEYQELNIIDILWKVLYGWRILVVCALIFAVVGGAYRVRSNVNYNNNLVQQESVDNTTTNESSFVAGSVASDSVSQAVTYYNKINALKSYEKESIYMNLDAYSVNQVSTQYYINTGYVQNSTRDIAPDYAGDLLIAYDSYVTNHGLLAKIYENLGWDTKQEYVGELIKVSTSNSENSNSFIISVYGDTEQHAVELAEAIDKEIRNYKSILEEQIGKHSLKVVDQYTGVGYDADLDNAKTTLSSNIINYQNQLNNLLNSMPTGQQREYELAIGNISGEEPSSVEEDTESLEDNSSLQSEELAEQLRITDKLMMYMILGFVVGIIIGAVINVLIYVLDGKIKTADECAGAFKLYLLGDFSLFEKKTGAFSKIDNWLIKLRNTEKWTYEEQLELTVANIKVLCEREDIHQLLISSTYHIDENAMKQIEDMKQRLKNVGIDLIVGDNIIRSAKTLENASQIGKMVLFEKVCTSKYEAIDKAVYMCKEQETDVLGVVVV